MSILAPRLASGVAGERRPPPLHADRRQAGEMLIGVFWVPGPVYVAVNWLEVEDRGTTVIGSKRERNLERESERRKERERRWRPSEPRRWSWPWFEEGEAVGSNGMEEREEGRWSGLTATCPGTTCPNLNFLIFHSCPPIFLKFKTSFKISNKPLKSLEFCPNFEKKIPT